MAAPTAKELLAAAAAAADAQPAPLGRNGRPLKATAGKIAARMGDGYSYFGVDRWYTQEGLDADAALALAHAFGWLNIPEDAREAAGLPPDPLKLLVAAVEELLAYQKEALVLLRALQREPRQEPELGRSTKRPKK